MSVNNTSQEQTSATSKVREEQQTILQKTWRWTKDNVLSVRVFDTLARFTLIFSALLVVYWSVIASDRYVSDANVVIRKTDSASTSPFDLGMLISGVAGVNQLDQLLLREYLLSVDMLQKLDDTLGLRQKFSHSDHDVFSRFWFEDAPAEWLYRYLRTMISVEFDELPGVLRIRSEAYDPQTAKAMTAFMVAHGEEYMNKLGHELADTQVDFLTRQVQFAREEFENASQALLAFQNREEMLTPKAQAESIGAIIASLESQRAQIETRLDALPPGLEPNHPNVRMLTQSIKSIDRQIAQERGKLTESTGGSLNVSLEQYQKLELAVEFSQQMYQSALMALEKGRFDATRMLDKVSILQAPTTPEYPLEPRRIYNSVVSIILALVVAGILKLLGAIVRDHVD
ncbi:chain-length determining protein [Orrella sp. 11846]|uniref:chain-length determining protein n=1 Tax=Orrella sp. 11846 TaxID=3409913 RepID=UPI003B5A3555